MGDNTTTATRFERLIDKINITYGLVMPVGLMTLAAALLWIFTPTYFQPNTFWLWIAVITSVGLAFGFHYKYVNRLTREQVRILYILYTIALTTFSICVAPFLSPFDFLWVILAIGIDLLYGRRRLILVFVLYCFTIALSAYSNKIAFNVNTVLQAITQLTGVVGTTMLVSKFREISDSERNALDNTSHSIAFERQRLLSLINNMGEAVIATDPKGDILLYNAAVLSLFDTNMSLEGTSLGKLLNLHDSKHHKVNLLSIISKAPTSITSTDYTHNFSKDDFINLYINISKVKLGFGEHSDNGYIAIFRDITKEKSLEDERDEFISVVSHELRTPVAIAEGNISNALFFADKSKEPANIKDSLNQAHDKVIFLADMINDLATLSRAERTDYQVEAGKVNVAEFVTQLQADYQSQASDKGLTLSATASKDSGELFTAPLYLKEVLQNFVTNAIKYTKKGHILVHARRSGDSVIFSVADSGIGLSKSDQKRVFDKFWRSEDYRTRESSGTGLGLYVTRKLTQKLNAKLSLESELNHGSTFTITVPNLKND